MDCYCVTRRKPISREETELQTATSSISGFQCGLLACSEIYCDWSLQNQHSWNFSGVHGSWPQFSEFDRKKEGDAVNILYSQVLTEWEGQTEIYLQ